MVCWVTYVNLFQETGWLPQHVIAQDEHKTIIGVVPLYLKRFLENFLFIKYVRCTLCLLWCLSANYFWFSFSHSNGEYVFDHSWADAYYRYGYQYYPKLQSCVPFTPVTGPRILVRDIWCRDQVFDMLVLALKDLAAKVFVLNVTDFLFCSY